MLVRVLVALQQEKISFLVEELQAPVQAPAWKLWFLYYEMQIMRVLATDLYYEMQIMRVLAIENHGF